MCILGPVTHPEACHEIQAHFIHRPSDRTGDPAAEKTMSQDQHETPHDGHPDTDGSANSRGRGRRYRDEVFSLRVPAGKRTYFFDVKTTRSGEDFFLTITESKRVSEDRYEKHKIFLYKEDFGKFVQAMHESVQFVQDECLPDYEFRGLPDLSEIEPEPEASTAGD